MRDTVRAGIEWEWGQTMAEYAVVLGVITLTGVAAFSLLSSGISRLLLQVADLF
jgi:Flp pilus assembly pilin Flp